MNIKECRFRNLKISWLSFILFSALYFTLINFKFFIFIYENLSLEGNLFLFIWLIVVYFCLLGAIFSLLFIPYLSKFLFCIFAIITAVSEYFMLNYGTIIDYTMIQNAMQTDSKEVYELINVKFLLYLIVLGIIPSVIVCKSKIDYYNFKRHLIIKPSVFVCFILIAVLIVLIFSKSIIPFFRNHNNARLYHMPFLPIYSTINYIKKEIMPKKEFKIISPTATLKDPNKKKVMVFVVGETARAANYSLGGYTKNDTNAYSKLHDVIYFSNVYSCGTATAISLPCMFSKSSRSEYSSDEYQENALDILQKAGVSVSWLENNSGGCKGVCNRVENKNFSNAYDGFLIDEVKNKLEHLSANNNIILIHIQGSHGPTYYKRYDETFKRFKPICNTNELSKCSNEEIVNTYDNTILYTDYIIAKIIDDLKALHGYESALLYVSDHGESLGENGVYLHGMPYFMAPSYQIHIPMIFWSNNTELNKLLKAKSEREFSHDNIFSTLLGYFGVDTQSYDSSLDITK